MGGGDYGLKLWAKGEPNDVGGSEDCIEMIQSVGYRYNDNKCTNQYAFICEINRSETLLNVYY